MPCCPACPHKNKQVTKEEYAAKGATALGSALLQQLRGQGANPYYIPVGGSSALGVWGYLQAIEEIRQQSQELGLSFDVIASVSYTNQGVSWVCVELSVCCVGAAGWVVRWCCVDRPAGLQPSLPPQRLPGLLLATSPMKHNPAHSH
jgi:hypothetical protein